MRYLILIFFFFTLIIGGASSCSKSENRGSPNRNSENNDTTMKSKIKIMVNSQTFTATLFDNNSAKAFREMLPVTIKMIELNGNEKYFDLPENLPTDATKPKSIRTGDLMVYGSNTFVLFYKTFSTSYSYTGLGRIDDPSGLAAALGSGDITVTFEAE
jgi:hypothetical protein